MLCLLATLAIRFSAHSATPPRELYEYLKKPDSSYSYRVVAEDALGTTVDLTSQTWQGRPWVHQILIRQPKNVQGKGTGILFITGDGPRPGDYRNLSLFAEATGMPVAMLFSIPNQPIWDLREDGLIAYTFDKFLQTGSIDWPLLFPMTKSAIRAMDAVQAVTAKSANPINRFVVTGASKRGWTTWFVGAAKDPRVIGIAPMVYDNLNVPRQMTHQIEQWGKYSEQIQDYTERGLQQKLTSDEGRHLADIIDPFSYRSNIKVPTLIVTGSNDRYWTADASHLYWKELKQPKWARVIPNVGHDLGGGLLAVEAVGAFARSVAGQFRMPTLSAEFTRTTAGIEAKWRAGKEPVVGAWIWTATSADTDFRDDKFERHPVPYVDSGRVQSSGLVEIPSTSAVAAFLEVRFRAKGREFSLTSPTSVLLPSGK